MVETQGQELKPKNSKITLLKARMKRSQQKFVDDVVVTAKLLGIAISVFVSMYFIEKFFKGK